MIPGKTAAGMGGAMDLVTGSKITIVMTTHTDKAGNPKIVQKTSMPLTGYHCINYVVSELAVIQITDEGAVLLETAPGVSVEDVVAKTGAKLIIPEHVGCMVE
jgi:3-oxoacid CoA-transferase B subunit